MAQRVTAIYEDGVLRLLSPLELPEHSQVEIDIRQVVSAKDHPSHRDLVRLALVNASLSLPPSHITAHTATPISAERREELAEMFSVGGPISELISEEREGR